MSLVITAVKFLASLGIAWAGLFILQPSRWALLKTSPLAIQVPPEWYHMRLERMGVGGAVLLLGVLCALTSLQRARA